MSECENDRCCIWLLDSGATNHVIHNERIFENLFQEKRQISLADKEGKILTSKGIGDVFVKQFLSKNALQFKDVLCVLELNCNLLSVAKITDRGYNVTFNI